MARRQTRHRRGRRTRLRAALVLGTVLATGACVATALAMIEVPGDESEPASARDAFGVRELRPTRPGGMTWAADWDGERRFTGVDPADPWFDADHGDGSFQVRDGALEISGPHPRMHVHHPDRERQWRDVEITMYFRSQVRGPSYTGMVAVARSNHGVTGDPDVDSCDSRGVGARLRNDGLVDVEKETSHPQNVVMGERRRWPDGLPAATWIGFKFLVQDQADGAVSLEVWVDESEGADGGAWARVLRVRDGGADFGEVACAPGIDPRLALIGTTERAGSESGLPNLSVYFRADGAGRNGITYKWGSVREIVAGEVDGGPSDEE